MTPAARSSHPRPRRNALVFGGSPRIDAAVVHRLAEDGFRVALAHAGASILAQDDGIGHYTGNYGNLLFIWDIIFGTARITRRTRWLFQSMNHTVPSLANSMSIVQ